MDEEGEEGEYWADAAAAARELNLEIVRVDAEDLASTAAITATTSQHSREIATKDIAEPQSEPDTIDYADYVRIRLCSTTKLIANPCIFYLFIQSIDDILDPDELERELAEA